MRIKEPIVNGFKETRRILRLTRKPRRSEFVETSKVTGAGIIIIGFIGFLIFLITYVVRNRVI